VRLAVSKNSGNMADPGSVSYQFARKGVILVPGSFTEDQILEATIEHGVEDLQIIGDNFLLTCDPSKITETRSALQQSTIDYESADVEFVSTLKVEVDVINARKVIDLIEALEELDDVQEVYTNMEISESVMAELEAMS
jgi:transcriptional/translational regulatory protein YebC/TACO1